MSVDLPSSNSIALSAGGAGGGRFADTVASTSPTTEVRVRTLDSTVSSVPGDHNSSCAGLTEDGIVVCISPIMFSLPCEVRPIGRARGRRDRLLSLLVPRESTPACMALSFPVSLRGGEGFSPGAAAVSPLRSRTAGLLERMLDFLRACTRPAPSAHEAPRSWRIFKNKQNLTRHVCAGELCTHTFSSRYSIPGLKPAKVVRACSCPNHSRLTPPSSIQPAQPWQTCMVYSLYLHKLYNLQRVCVRERVRERERERDSASVHLHQARQTPAKWRP